VREQMKDFTWWKDKEIVHLMSRVAKAGRLDHLKRKINRINAAIDDGADIEKMNEFVKSGKFNGHNIDEMIAQAK